MSVCSLGFLALCVAVVIVSQLASGKRLRQPLLAAASAVFLFSYVPNVRSWALFAAGLAGTYVALVSVRVSRRRGVAAAATGLSVSVVSHQRETRPPHDD